MSEQTSQDIHNKGAATGGQPPAAAAAPAAPAPASTRPTMIDIAFWALIGSAALLLIRIPMGIVIANSAAHKEALDEYWGPYINMPAYIPNIITTPLIIQGLVSCTLTVLLALFIRKGHNWARIVLIVFAVGWSLNARVQFTEAVPMFATAWVTLVSVLLTITAIVCSFLPASSAYIKSMKQYRKGKKPSQG